MDADTCVCCGSIVPEGRMVCPRCEQKEVKCVKAGGLTNDIRISQTAERKISR